MKTLSNCCNANIEQDLSPQGVYDLTSGCLICSKCKKYCGYGRVVEGNSYCDQCTLNSPHTHSGMKIMTDSNPPNESVSTGTLTPLGEELQKPCLRCDQPWIRHDCPSEHSGSIYKHIVYNPLMQNIKAVIENAQDEETLNSGLEWQFVRSQPVTEYEWVAIFEKWIY